MAIERSIYASLPLGVEQDTPGFQYYSYTPKFRSLLEADASGTLKSVSTAGYTEPSGNEWLCDLPEDADCNRLNENDYHPSMPQGAEQANAAELKARKFHPYSLSYKTINVGGTEKAVFWFGKNLGVDWSGGRPGNKYIYSLVCEPSDIKKDPILYCSSPAVCCNIFRSEFFSQSQAPAKPELLKYIDSLEETDDLAPTEYSEGFDEISADEISELLNTDDNLDIFCSMLSALMEYKDGNNRLRLIIADERRNIMLWIAALSYVFPLENTRGLSFSSYTYSPSDFDINGVFVPSLNYCFKSSKTRYDFQTAKSAYAVYDFSEGSFAPEVTVKNELFASMIKSAFKIDPSRLDSYKRYITEHTNFRGLGSDYALGSSLFSYMTGMKTYSLSDAVEFAKKYTNAAEKKSLLKKMLDDYEKFSEKAEDLRAVNEFMEYCCSNGVETRENINQIFADKFSKTFFSETADDSAVQRTLKACAEMCGCSEDELSISFAEKTGLGSLLEFIKRSRSSYRILFIQRAALLRADKKNIRITSRSDEGRIAAATIDFFVADDSQKSISQIQGYITENFKLLRNVSSRIGLCDSILSALDAKRLHSCSETVITAVAEMYLSGSTAERGELMSAVSSAEFSDRIAYNILNRVESEPDIGTRLEGLLSFCRCGGNFAREYSKDITDCISGSLELSKNVSHEEELKIYGTAFDLLKTVTAEYGANPSAADYQSICEKYVGALFKVHPDYIVEKNELEKLDDIRLFTKRAGGDGGDDAFELFESLLRMKENLGVQKDRSCFLRRESINFKTVDVSALERSCSEVYLASVGRLCGEFWAKTEIMPMFSQLVKCDTHQAAKTNQAIFTAMFKTTLKETKGSGRCAADVIEYSMVQNYTEVLNTMDDWLSECTVKKNVIDHLTKDYKAKTESKKSSGFELLNQIDASALLANIETVKKHYESSGGILNGIKSLFKRKD